MPLEYITDKYRRGRRGTNPGMGQAFPSPSKHIDMTSGWNPKFNVTVSTFNDNHHVSQREYFDRPIVVPQTGYSHIRAQKAEVGTVYSSKTPMRSTKHV